MARRADRVEIIAPNDIRAMRRRLLLSDIFLLAPKAIRLNQGARMVARGRKTVGNPPHVA